MQHDEVIWQIIRHHHCSYMAKIETGIFCRNKYNLTGVCNRSSCPLANSRYATIVDHDGVFYLYVKTIERAHMPNKLWERIKLPRNYVKALELIDKELMYWPKFLVHKAKQRLTKMTQMRIRMRRLALKTREKTETMPRKETKREARREQKAEKAALIEKNIEKELVERLKAGVYSDIVNVPLKNYLNVLDVESTEQLEVEEEDEDEEPVHEFVEGYDELLEEEDMEDFADFAGYTHKGEVDEDDEELPVSKSMRKKKQATSAPRVPENDVPSSKSKKRARVVIEVEHEGGNQTKMVH
ncbi:hypothetical protein Droror1_Dr00023210 [Drosera rotundifolia]